MGGSHISMTMKGRIAHTADLEFVIDSCRRSTAISGANYSAAFRRFSTKLMVSSSIPI